MRRILGTSLGALCALAASIAPAQDLRTPARRALLVGIGHYPPELHWPPLEGPAPDVTAMRSALVTRFGFEPSNVEELTDEAATHRGIAAAFDRLVDRSAPGDTVLFYFAGHGSRLPDDDPDEELDGWDETLVPYDACLGEHRDNDIRDDEIGRWIARANLKTDQVVLIFDCCSSGTNVRDEGPGRSRYLSPEDRFRPRPGETSTPRGFDAPRGLGVAGASVKGSGWVPTRPRCVALSACRAEESAFEIRVGSAVQPSDSGPARGPVGETRGLFTMSLIDELASIDSDASWSDLMLRVSARVGAKTNWQTPVIEGALAGYGVFRNVATSRAPRFESEITISGDLRLHGGLLQGLAPGAVVAVCTARTERDDASRRVGEAVISKATAGESIAQWRTPAGSAVEPGACTVFLLQYGDSPGPLPVSVEGLPGRSAALAELLTATHLVERVDAVSARIRIVANENSVRKEWGVFDCSGRARSESVEDSEEGLPRLVRGITTLARAWRVEQILTSSTARDLRAEVALRMLGDPNQDGSRASLGPPERDQAGHWKIPLGKAWCAYVANRSDVPLYANLILVFPDGEILVSCPPGPDERVLPGGVPWRCAPGELEIPAGKEAFYAAERVHLYCVLTPRWHDLSALAQDSFSTGPALRGASPGAASNLDDDTWSTISMELAVR